MTDITNRRRPVPSSAATAAAAPTSAAPATTAATSRRVAAAGPAAGYQQRSIRAARKDRRPGQRKRQDHFAFLRCARGAGPTLARVCRSGAAGSSAERWAAGHNQRDCCREQQQKEQNADRPIALQPHHELQ